MSVDKSIMNAANKDYKAFEKNISDKMTDKMKEKLNQTLSDSIPESYLKQLEIEEGFGSDFLDIVRKTLHGVIKDSDFSERLEGRIHGIVCPLVEKINSKFVYWM